MHARKKTLVSCDSVCAEHAESVGADNFYPLLRYSDLLPDRHSEMTSKAPAGSRELANHFRELLSAMSATSELRE